MSDVQLQCVNPDDIKLELKVTLPIAQWEEIAARAKEAKYYSPLQEIIEALTLGCAEIRQRQTIRGKK